MRIRPFTVVSTAVALGLGTLTAAADASDHAPVRMNQIQMLGSHNSYHREVSFAEKKIQGESDPDNLWYSHASLRKHSVRPQRVTVSGVW
ncbi:Ca2+-dependent phosphoinositide-specific phospholipase C [Streptomyces sp. NPDC005181]|uniref:Ca2+-dependent phosphoinositide-specific phospholipase C n=1 Tax=Streptomyces sp. NPDC005181 TaxID=3156869 RepID=UPI0033AD4443